MSTSRAILYGAAGVVVSHALAAALIAFATRPAAVAPHRWAEAPPPPTSEPTPPPRPSLAPGGALPVLPTPPRPEAAPTEVVWPPGSRGEAIIPVPQEPEAKVDALVAFRNRRKAQLIEQLNRRGR